MAGGGVRMSIDMAAVRASLAEAITDAVLDDVTVYPRGVDGTFTAPAVVIGQPSIEFEVQPCIDRWTVPVAVAVDRTGIDETATQQQLENTWPAVASALAVWVDAGEWPAGVTHAAMTRADFGQLLVQGQSFPAQEIQLEIYG